MKRDDRVFLLGEDVGGRGGSYKATDTLLEKFGRERVYDTPISEGAIAGAAVGAALAGLRPVAEIMYIDFSTLALDQIANQGAKFHFMTGGQAIVPLVSRWSIKSIRLGGVWHTGRRDQNTC